MSTNYRQLLDTTINYLERLKAQGARFVPVSPATLKALAESAPSKPRPPVALAKPAPLVQFEPEPIAVKPATQRMGNSTQTKPPPATVKPLAESASLDPKDDLESKARRMAELRERALNCVKCPHLVSSRKTVVFGVGDINSLLMFVGEAPGADEDEQGEPFVGRAGQLLNKIIQAMGLTRETVYIGNILKCRPDTPGQSFGNRKPTPEEMQTCIPYLQEQIDIIQPKVIVGLGATAIEGLLGKTSGITKLRGQWQTYRSIPLMPTFHPSFLLRPENASKKRLVWEDMLQVMEKLGLPISEKQRSFFAK